MSTLQYFFTMINPLGRGVIKKINYPKTKDEFRVLQQEKAFPDYRKAFS